jgi:hypothetical protein
VKCIVLMSCSFIFALIFSAFLNHSYITNLILSKHAYTSSSSPFHCLPFCFCFSAFSSLSFSLPSFPLSFTRSNCQDFSIGSLCCVLPGWHSTATELDCVPRPHYSYTVHGPSLATRCVLLHLGPSLALLLAF